MFSRRDWLPFLFLAAWPIIYFFPITLGQGVWFGYDISISYFPTGLEVTRALDVGRLPFWSTGVGAGYPVLAEGQAGPLYPSNVILYKLFPTELAISYGMLLHLIWMAWGMYGCARFFGLRREAAVLAALIVSFNGYILAQLMHPNVVFVMAWLPWLILGGRLTQHARWRGVGFCVTTLAIAMQWLAGFPQTGLLNIIALLGFSLFDFFSVANFSRAAIYRSISSVALPVIIGTGLAAAQILPTLELIGQSVRGTGLGISAVTSYSLPPEYLTQFLFPFTTGSPSNQTNEYFAYTGNLAFWLALLAPFLRRNKQTIFLALFALATLSLALGEANPLFIWLGALPPFSFFRVPARYLHLAIFAIALLSASSFEAILQRLGTRSRIVRYRMLGYLAFGLPILGVIALGQTQPVEFWLGLWRWLPLVFIFCALLTIGLALGYRINANTFAVFVLGLCAFDLACYAPLFQKTIDPIVTSDYARLVPRSLEAIRTTAKNGRVFSDQSVAAIFPGTRNSLMPNTGLIYEKSSALIYSSLALARHQSFVGYPSPAMFNLLNAHYFTMSLLPRPRSRPLMPFRNLALDLLNNETPISLTLTSEIELASFTEWGDEIDDKTPVAELIVHTRDDKTLTWPIRLGIETADWDYELKESAYARAPVARSFPAYWRSNNRLFDGHVYSARFQLPESSEIDVINVRPLKDVGFTIESTQLIDDRGQSVSLAQLTGKNQFKLVYLSDTVAVWENADALPRAFMVHNAEIASDEKAFAQLRAPGFHPDLVTLLAEGQPIAPDADKAHDTVTIDEYESERVSLSVSTDQSGYLILADTWYPGWSASIDGQPAPLYRADVIFRAVPISPGAHRVVFEFRSMPFVIGAAISIISCLLAFGVFLFYSRSGTMISR